MKIDNENTAKHYKLLFSMHICSHLHFFHLQLCMYNKDDQPVYVDIGEQTDVFCDISDGKVALIYPVQYVSHTLWSTLDVSE